MDLNFALNFLFIMLEISQEILFKELSVFGLRENYQKREMNYRLQLISEYDHYFLVMDFIFQAMFFWTTLYFHSVTAAPTWLVTPLSLNLNSLCGKFQHSAEFLSFGLHFTCRNLHNTFTLGHLSFWTLSQHIYVKNLK